MRRKKVQRRLFSIAEVRTALTAHRAKVGARLDERVNREGGASFSYQSQFDHMDRELSTIENGLITAEDRHVRKQVQIEKLRQQSKTFTTELYRKQTSARAVLTGLYGTDHGFELGALTGKTPQVAHSLIQQVDQTIKLLRHPELPLPPPIIAGVAPDFTLLADDLEAALTSLETSRIEYQQTLKEADQTRSLTQAAITACDRIFQPVVSSLESTFRLAGETELASRIRTSSRRVTRRQAVPEKTAEEGSKLETGATLDDNVLGENVSGDDVQIDATASPAQLEASPSESTVIRQSPRFRHAKSPRTVLLRPG